jgi:putative ABC transport system ATP-binding protein
MTIRLNTAKSHQPLITLTGISKTYQNAAGSFTALKDINLNFYTGEFIGVIGKSGSGKSTLVNMITGIDRPTTGNVLVGDNNIHAMRESAQARWRGLNMGVVFQFFQLLPMLTLVENVLLPMDFCDKYDHEKRVERAMDLLEMVGLDDVAHKLPGSVSGGQQQSAAIARALANDPPIIVADEPTGNLDVRTADSVYEIFTTLADEGRTIIMITHDPEIEERLSRKVIISDGEVIDPILVEVFPWLPHTGLRKLTHTITHRTLQPGETLDISGILADQLIMVESGVVHLSTLSGESVLLKRGGFLLGSGFFENHEDRLTSCQVNTAEPAAVMLLTRGDLEREMEASPRSRDRLISDFHRQFTNEVNRSRDGEGGIR